MSAAERKLASVMRGDIAQHPAAAPQIKTVPTPTLRPGDVHLGDTAAKIPIGMDLAKLIDGRLLIQGNSGAGKSMLLRRLFEQAFGRVQQLLVDLDGEFSTLSENFDVAILTAADVQRVGCSQFALHLREHRYSAVLDLSDARSEEQLALIADLANGLLAAPERLWHPLLVEIDEAQKVAPHYDTGDIEADTRKRAIAALADLMGRGRKRGIAGIIATQRLSETAKAVAAKATNIIVGRTFLDRDVDRAGSLLGFTVGQSRPLRTLADGEFICLGPAIQGPTRIRFRAGAVQSRHKGRAPQLVQPPKVGAAETMGLLKAVPAAAATPPAPSDAGRGKSKPGRRGRDWRQEEDAVIRAGYEVGLPIAQIGAQLAAIGFNTSVSNISMRAHALGLVSARAAVAFSDREDEIIRDAYVREVKLIDIVDLLAAEGFQRGRVSIQMRAIHLGITRDRVNYWTEAEKAIAVAGLTDGKPYREILEDLRKAGFHRGPTALFKFAQKNNFSRKSESWTLEQIEELKKLYAKRPPMPVKEIAEALGKPIAAVRTRASNMGLRMREGWTDRERQLLIKEERLGTTSIADIALQIGRPTPNVYAEARRLGLDIRKFGTNKRGSKRT